MAAIGLLIMTRKPGGILQRLMTFSFENTMYGTLGPERTVWDEEADSAMKQSEAEGGKDEGGFFSVGLKASYQAFPEYNFLH